MVDLSVQIQNVKFKNPILTASGCFGYGTEYKAYFDPSLLGGIVTKTITLSPREGNPMPRIVETPSGMLNSIGLANVGLERFLTEKLPLLDSVQTAVIVSVAGNTVEEYGEVVARLENHPRVDAFELNVSCPNVKEGGIAFGQDPKMTFEVVRTVREKTKKPIIVKLTPNVTQISDLAVAAVEGGADAISLINTVKGMAVDIETRRPCIARAIAGLSGPAVKPIALAKVYEVRQVVEVPIIGIGGIVRWQDAIEFLIVGASAVQIGSGFFIEPDAPVSILEGIRKYCETKGISQLSELIGTLILEDFHGEERIFSSSSD